MKIKRNMMVSLEYDLTDSDGNLLDSSKGIEPLEYLHGYGMLIEGMEETLEGRSVGEHFVTDIAPEKAYGILRSELIMEVPRANFPDDVELEVGMEFDAGSEGAPRLVYIKELKDDLVVIDANHPLAGKTLHFDVNILSVREASEAELAAVLMPSCGGCACGPGIDPSTCGGGCACP